MADYYKLNGQRLWGVVADEETEETEHEIHHVLGHGRKVDFGDNLGTQGQLTVQLYDRGGEGGPTARAQRETLKALQRSRQSVTLETPYGDVYNVAVAEMSFTRMPGVGVRDFGTVTIPYWELA
jgi:hypothetical protein